MTSRLIKIMSLFDQTGDGTRARINFNGQLWVCDKHPVWEPESGAREGGRGGQEDAKAGHGLLGHRLLALPDKAKGFQGGSEEEWPWKALLLCPRGAGGEEDGQPERDCGR